MENDERSRDARSDAQPERPAPPDREDSAAHQDPYNTEDKANVTPVQVGDDTPDLGKGTSTTGGVAATGNTRGQPG